MTVKILHGDSIEVMRYLPAESVDCCVTSPPYWGLRDYDCEGQIGLEKSLGDHLEVMVNVFREVRRLLKPAGTLWLNYGDCYATTPNGKKAADYKADGSDNRAFRDKPFSTIGPINSSKRMPRGSGRYGGGNLPASGILKPKDLCMIPNRLAIALQEDGWWVRSEIIWAKPNPMPESVRDRPATSHEKIFLLSKSDRYFYNLENSKMPMAATSQDRLAQDIEAQAGSGRANGGRKANGPMKAVGGKSSPPGQKPQTANRKQDGHSRRHEGFNERYFGGKGNSKTFRGGNYSNGVLGDRDSHGNTPNETGLRNLRNYEPAPTQIWEMATQPFKSAHFATFPPELAERCIKAGCQKGGVVFDPFGGAGTTGLVAAELGHDAIMIELNKEYINIARARIRAGLHRVSCKLPEDVDAGPLFGGHP